jgi:hypothetical protein
LPSMRGIPARRPGAGIDLDQPPRAGICRNFFMAPHQHPPVRPCPLCGLAMLASKSREDAADFDTFQCLTCLTTISRSRPAPPGSEGNAR